MARESPLQSGFKSHSHKRLTFVFTGESGYTRAFANRIVHTGSHGETRGVSDGGGITTLGVRCVVRNLCARSGQKSILCHLCMDRGNVGEKQRAFGTETRTVRVSVPRRRGPAGLRDPVAVSLTALMGFTVLVAHDNSTPRKILAGFTRRFHTPVRSMRLATRCRSVALSTASICR